MDAVEGVVHGAWAEQRSKRIDSAASLSMFGEISPSNPYHPR